MIIGTQRKKLCSRWSQSGQSEMMDQISKAEDADEEAEVDWVGDVEKRDKINISCVVPTIIGRVTAPIRRQGTKHRMKEIEKE